MSEPTTALDALEQANASHWHRPDLEEVVRRTAPRSDDESFEIPDLTDDEWEEFVGAIHE